MEVDPPDSARSASSVWANDELGKGHHRGRLDSPQAWSSAHKEREGEWYSIDLESVVFVAGVVTRGRADCPQWVTGFKVQTSHDGSDFADVDRGITFPGNTDQNTPVQAEFKRPVRARVVRIFPQAANGHMSMRCGVLIQDAERRRPSCFYGSRCRNTQARHRATFAHPDDWDFEEVDIVVGRNPEASLKATRLFNLIDVSDSGMLDRPEIQQASGVIYGEIKTAFRIIDSNHDGTIDEDELRAILVRIGVPETDVGAMFDAADLNKDGKVDYGEFLDWLAGPSPAGLGVSPMVEVEATDYDAAGRVDKVAWTRKMNALFEAIGKEAFIDRVNKQIHVMSRQLGKQGATILYKGLPDPLDGLQQHAMDFVSGMWGADIVYRRFCQEYGMRNHARVVHVSGSKEYTPPSTGRLMTFHGGSVVVERAVKIAIRNPKPDLDTWDISYHGIDTHARDRWKASGPMFSGYGGAHGPGIYTTPSFSLAGAYAVRRWTREWRYDDVPAEYCEGMHFIAILMCALEPGKFKKCNNTAAGASASTEGWQNAGAEWVIPGEPGKEVPGAQIYGVNFCYFRDNPRVG